MTSKDGDTSPSSPVSSATLPRVRSPEKATARRPYSEFNVPFRRSTASLSTLFSATSVSASLKRASTPVGGVQSLISRTQSTSGLSQNDEPINSSVFRDTIVGGFAPRVALLPSADVEELLAQKGLAGGLLELLRPYGESIPGKVTIRDSTGSSKSWENYSVKFARLRDGLDDPKQPSGRTPEAPSHDINGYLDRMIPHTSARLRTGGDIEQIEQNVARHITFFESTKPDLPGESEQQGEDETGASPFQLLYLQRLLSGLPVTPHESFSHPVACAFAVTSRNNDPIEELRQLSSSATHGDERLPPFISGDFLRYFVLIHDEDHDDVQRTQSIYEQIKRHFGLHCHLLRVRSSQCVPSDDDAVQLPSCNWISAAEELSEIERCENADGLDAPRPYLYESDAAAVKALVREMITQSVIPMMERHSATWNDQVVSRRRGISGRFISLSRRWTPFGGSKSSSSASGTNGPSNTSYDVAGGFYRPDSAEAIMRRLADFAVMLRDYKLAHSVYDLIRGDYNNDKAWKYYAGAAEMTVVTALLLGMPLSSKNKSEGVEQIMDAAVYSYLGRCGSPFNALRALVVGVELLHLRDGAAADEAAKWAGRIVESELVGPVGTVLLYERIASAYASRRGVGSKDWGSRRRKSAMWRIMSTQAWLEQGWIRLASQNFAAALHLYRPHNGERKAVEFEDIIAHLDHLKEIIAEREGDVEAFEDESSRLGVNEDDAAEDIETETLGVSEDQMRTLGSRSTAEMDGEHPLADDKADKPVLRTHRKSLIGIRADSTDRVASSEHSSRLGTREASPAP